MKDRSSIEWYDMGELPYRASRLLRALSNPKAYALCRILSAEGPMEVGDLSRRLRRSQPTVSRILRSFRDLNVVRYQKKRGATWYILKHPGRIRRILDGAEAFILHADPDLEDRPKRPGF